MIALVTGVVVAAAVLTVVLTNSDSGTRTEAAPQVALQPVAATGPDPFTGSVAVVSNASTAASSGGTVSATGTDGRTVQGSDPGLYGGSQQTASCDVPRLAEFLNANQDKARAWAAVAGIEPAAIGDYLRSLTSVVLRVDTRVTNHGFANGVATPYQAVLQSGTAVLIDARGLPRVRCACGNPLLPPVLSATPPAYSGTPWPSFKEQDVVAVSPAPSPLKDIVVVDPSSGQSFTHQVSGSPSSSTSGSGTGSSAGSKPATGSASGPASGSKAPSSGTSSGELGSGAPSSGAASGSAGTVTSGQQGGASSAGGASAGGASVGSGSAG